MSDTDGAVDGSLLAALARVPDPRSRQGIRHEIGYLLAVIIAATAAAGHDSVAAIAQWAADAPATVLAALGGRADPWTGLIPAPSRQTPGRVLARIEVTRSRAEADAWTRANTEVPDAVAIDGKSMRGAAAGGNHRQHLLSAATHDGIVLTQRQIPDKGSEISQVAPLIAGLDLTGKVVTLDAPRTQRGTAEHLVSVAGAHYVMTVKSNQPKLLAACQAALSGPAADFAEHTAHDRGHGRTEERITRVAPVTEDLGIDFPHAAQIFRVIRYTGGPDGQRTTKEVAWSITSLPTAQAGAPELGSYLRGHWSIENATHWVRDMTFGEDASTLRTGTAPHAMPPSAI